MEPLCPALQRITSEPLFSLGATPKTASDAEREIVYTEQRMDSSGDMVVRREACSFWGGNSMLAMWPTVEDIKKAIVIMREKLTAQVGFRNWLRACEELH
jgi:hypothetical protein